MIAWRDIEFAAQLDVAQGLDPIDPRIVLLLVEYDDRQRERLASLFALYEAQADQLDRIERRQQQLRDRFDAFERSYIATHHMLAQAWAERDQQHLLQRQVAELATHVEQMRLLLARTNVRA